MNWNETRFVSRIEEANSSSSIHKGIGLRWEKLTQTERIVFLGITLIPVWWLIGWTFVPMLWIAGISGYELYRYQQIRLAKPSSAVIFLLLFAAYRSLSYAINTPEIAPRALIDPFFNWGCLGWLLWYVQSHRLRVRLEVAAWAFSVVTAVMFATWVFCHFVLAERSYTPLPSLMAFLTKQERSYVPGALGTITNFLIPYYFTGSKGIWGFSRYTFFLSHPTVSSFFIGFVGLIALDLKKRQLWSFWLITVCAFLIFICQTRNAWISLSIVLILRWLVIMGKAKGASLILAFIAIVSFATLSVPPITDYVTDTYAEVTEATSGFRQDSTDVRNKIYQETLESIPEKPFLGHGVERSLHHPGYEYAQVGTESFVLGTLIYKSGLLGSGLFITFFVSFVVWLHRTRHTRPLCVFLMLTYFSLASLVTEFDKPEVFIVVLCVMLTTSERSETTQQYNLMSSGDRDKLDSHRYE